MRNLFTILFAILVSSCTSSDSHPVAPPPAPGAPRPTPFPNLAILVKVSGDPRTGDSRYRFAFDGSPWIVAEPNVENRMVVPAGNHTISVPPLRGESWCTALGPSSFSGPISGDSVTKIIFPFDCPPLVGTGKLQLSLSGTGSGAPAGVLVSLTKLNDPLRLMPGFSLKTARFVRPESSYFTVPTDKPSEVTMPTGLYSIIPVLPPNCLPFVVLGTGVPVVAIRDGRTATVRFSYSCI